MNNARGNIYIAGIGGTFMGGVAQLAHAAEYAVRGCDTEIYSPMREVLQRNGIPADKNYDPQHLGAKPGRVLIGNVLSRGNPLVEHILEHKIPFQSGPAWVYENILASRAVIAIAGTHGKTTTASILAWMLDCAGVQPGFLIGGQPGNFDASARLGGGEHFVIEADEYDTAFFDKRAKFVHYHPRIAVLNNLEFDHADIYADIAQIQRQFHHLLRIVPPNGCVIVNAADARLREVLDMGCWSRRINFAAADASGNFPPTAALDFRARPLRRDCGEFEILQSAKPAVKITWGCVGLHNMQNALAAFAAAMQAGVAADTAAAALRNYIPPARRMQVLFQSSAVALYDDFAHHPSAIHAALQAARAKHPRRRIIAVLELRSNTMQMGVHGDALFAALQSADYAYIVGAPAALEKISAPANPSSIKMVEYDQVLNAVQNRRRENDVIVMMSNGDFQNLPRRYAAMLNGTATATEN